MTRRYSRTPPRPGRPYAAVPGDLRPGCDVSRAGGQACPARIKTLAAVAAFGVCSPAAVAGRGYHATAARPGTGGSERIRKGGSGVPGGVTAGAPAPRPRALT